MAYEVGVAYLSIVPETSKIAPGITSAMGKASAPAQKQGSAIGGALATGLKRTAQTALAGGALFAGISIKKGLDRLLQIDDARASLTGLGHDVRSVDKIMANALASVKGTAFGLGDAGEVAASAVAAGIKPGKDLTRTLKLTADAATIAKTDMGSMGAIFNKVATSGKIQGDVIAQLNDANIPIVQLMAKELGKTSAETVKLASEGKINFATFQDAMEKGLGGAALESGNTARGAFANVGASLSRIGAGLLGGTFPHLAPAFKGITKALAPLQSAATVAGDKIGMVLGPALENIGPGITKMTSGLGSVDFSSWGDGSSQIGRAFQSIGESIKGIDWGQLGTAFGKGAADTVSVFAVAVGFLADHLDLLARVMPALLAGFAAFKIAQAANNVLMLANVPIRAANTIALGVSAKANNRLAAQMAIANGVEAEGTAIRGRSTVALVASKVAAFASATATKAMTLAQRGLNLVMRMNPIGLLITGLILLGTALYTAYQKSDTFRAIVNAAFGAVKKVVGAVLSWLGSAVKNTIAFVGRHWRLIISIIGGPIGLVIAHFGTLKAGLGKVKDAFVTIVGKIGDAWAKIKSLARKPVAFVVNSVIRPFTLGLNKILPGNPIPVPAKFSEGGYTGRLSPRAIAGVVHGDEQVIKSGSRRKIEKRAPGVLDYMNTYGEIPGYAGGGRVMPLKNPPHWTSYPGHTGIDYPVGTGTPVFATEGGRISQASNWNYSYGHHLRLAGKSGFTTIYAHLQRLLASRGQGILPGQLIGLSDSTGNSTGPHLHFEVRPGGTAGAALRYLNGAGKPSGGGGNPLSAIKDFFTHKMPGFIHAAATHGGMFGSSFGGLVKSIGGKLLGAITDKLKSTAKTAGRGFLSGLLPGGAGFDSGGVAGGPGMMLKHTVAPERVLSPRQTVAFEKAAERGFGGSESITLSRESMDYLIVGVGDHVLSGATLVADGRIAANTLAEQTGLAYR